MPRIPPWLLALLLPAAAGAHGFAGAGDPDLAVSTTLLLAPGSVRAQVTQTMVGRLSARVLKELDADHDGSLGASEIATGLALDRGLFPATVGLAIDWTPRAATVLDAGYRDLPTQVPSGLDGPPITLWYELELAAPGEPGPHALDWSLAVMASRLETEVRAGPGLALLRANAGTLGEDRVLRGARQVRGVPDAVRLLYVIEAGEGPPPGPTGREPGARSP